MEFENETLVNVKLFTKYERYQMGTNTISLPTRFSRYELSKLVNEALELEKTVPFDFIIDGKLLRVSLSDYISRNNLSLESTISLEYVPIISKPEEKLSEDLPDWVGGIASCSSIYVAGCYDGSLHVYNQEDKLVAKQAVHKRPIKGVDCQVVNGTPIISTVSLDNTMHVMKLENEKLSDMGICGGHNSHTLCCKINPENGLAVSGAWNGTIFVWDTNTLSMEKENEPVHSLNESVLGISSLGWWDMNVVSGGWDHTIRIWDLDVEATTTDMKGNKVINSLDINREMKLIASGHPDGVIRLWDSRQEKPNVLSFLGKNNFISSVSWNPVNGNLIQGCDYAGNMLIYDIRSVYPLHITEGVHKGKILASTWKSEDMLITGGEDKKLKRLSVKNE